MVDLTTGMSIEAKRQIDDFQKRIKVLEQQNQQLRRHTDAEAVISALGGGGISGGTGGSGGQDEGGQRTGRAGAR